MAVITLFRALRPTPESAARVAAVPYDVVNAQEAHALANGNPLSFLTFHEPKSTCHRTPIPHADAVYGKAVENFATLEVAGAARGRGRAQPVCSPPQNGESRTDRRSRDLLNG